MKSLVLLIAIISLHIIAGGLLWMTGKNTPQLIDDKDKPSHELIENTDSAISSPRESNPRDTSNDNVITDTNRNTTPTQSTPPQREITHVVKKNEFLSSIALKHKVNLKKLMQANNIKNANQLRIGQKLKIPQN